MKTDPHTIDKHRYLFKRKRVEGLERLMGCADLNAECVDVDMSLHMSQFLSPQELASLPESYFNSLYSSNEIRISNASGDARIIERSTFERRLLDQQIWPQCARYEFTILEVLHLIARTYIKAAGVGMTRTQGVGLADHDGNMAVIFLSVEDLNMLDSQISAISEATGSTVLRAILIFFTIVHYHPYSDGNGRVARTMFNIILRRGGLSERQYLPLFDIMHRSRGKYEVALRYAEVFGNWVPLTRFMVSAFRIARVQ